jgi:myo-inositol-1(or 4)-monophosphatase
MALRHADPSIDRRTAAEPRVLNDATLSVAIRAVRNAASVIEDAALDLKRLPSFSKEHADIASSAEEESTRAIATTLLNAFPDHAVLGKQPGAYEGRNKDAAYRWVIDPLDGAANFLRAYPYYAITIALTHGPEITHAVVLDPVRDEIFTAIKNQGAQFNGVPARVSSCTELQRASIGTVFPARTSTKLTGYLPILNGLISRCAEIRRAGACSLDMAYVAAGRLDGFFVMSLKGRDVAAGALLVREAGGMLGDFAGGSDFLKNNEVIAAAPGVFAPLRETIAAARP